jgi:hypothetical protein
MGWSGLISGGELKISSCPFSLRVVRWREDSANNYFFKKINKFVKISYMSYKFVKRNKIKNSRKSKYKLIRWLKNKIIIQNFKDPLFINIK